MKKFIFLINLHFQPYQEFPMNIVFHRLQLSKINTYQIQIEKNHFLLFYKHPQLLDHILT